MQVNFLLRFHDILQIRTYCKVFSETVFNPESSYMNFSVHFIYIQYKLPLIISHNIYVI